MRTVTLGWVLVAVGRRDASGWIVDWNVAMNPFVGGEHDPRQYFAGAHRLAFERLGRLPVDPGLHVWEGEVTHESETGNAETAEGDWRLATAREVSRFARGQMRSHKPPRNELTDPVTHVLVHGLAICGKRDLPVQWAGDKWCYEKDAATDCTCERCLNALKRLTQARERVDTTPEPPPHLRDFRMRPREQFDFALAMMAAADRIAAHAGYHCVRCGCGYKLTDPDHELLMNQYLNQGRMPPHELCRVCLEDYFAWLPTKPTAEPQEART